MPKHLMAYCYWSAMQTKHSDHEICHYQFCISLTAFAAALYHRTRNQTMK
ncbi:MAG: hypothetical protein ABI923_10445 [bacterium]